MSYHLFIFYPGHRGWDKSGRNTQMCVATDLFWGTPLVEKHKIIYILKGSSAHFITILGCNVKLKCNIHQGYSQSLSVRSFDTGLDYNSMIPFSKEFYRSLYLVWHNMVVFLITIKISIQIYIGNNINYHQFKNI